MRRKDAKMALHEAVIALGQESVNRYYKTMGTDGERLDDAVDEVWREEGTATEVAASYFQ